MAPHSSTLAWKIPWTEEPGRLQSIGSGKSGTRLSDFTFTFHFHALEKEMAAHSCILGWRIPGMGEPGVLPSMGSHRVGHDWRDLAAAAAAKHNVKSGADEWQLHGDWRWGGATGWTVCHPQVHILKSWPPKPHKVAACVERCFKEVIKLKFDCWNSSKAHIPVSLCLSKFPLLVRTPVRFP